MERTDTFVSIVAHLRNSDQYVQDFIREAHKVLSDNYTNFEMVLIDDSSTDCTVQKVKELMTDISCLRLIDLSKTMGKEIALAAGLESAIGDFVVTMSPDHDPVSEIPAMVQKARGGYDVVEGSMSGRTGFVYSILRAFFVVLNTLFGPQKLPRGSTYFRVFSRKSVNAFMQLRWKRRFFALLNSEIGYRVFVHEYEPFSRSGKRPGPRLGEAVFLGLSIILRSSILPLRMVGVLGLTGSLLSFAYIGYVVAVNFYKDRVMEGWTTLSLQISGLFLLMFLMMTLMSEYIGRLLEENDGGPLYHVKGEANSSVMLSDSTRTNVLGRSVVDDPGTQVKDSSDV